MTAQCTSSGNLFQMIDNENKTMKAHAIFSYTFYMLLHYPACIRVPVKCEMKRETKYTETERNEMKRNEIYQNETKRNETK
jgi:hypothetical protein